MCLYHHRKHHFYGHSLGDPLVIYFVRMVPMVTITPITLSNWAELTALTPANGVPPMMPLVMFG